MMLIVSLCAISCGDDDSNDLISPDDKNRKKLVKMELKTTHRNDPLHYGTAIYKYNSNNEISEIYMSTIEKTNWDNTEIKDSIYCYVDDNALIFNKTRPYNQEYVQELNSNKYIRGIYLDHKLKPFFNHIWDCYYHSNGYLKSIQGSSHRFIIFEPTYDKQWRITNGALGSKNHSSYSIECVWSDIPNKGNLFFWEEHGDSPRKAESFYMMALENAGFLGKAQAFLPEKFADTADEYNLSRIQYELDNEGYVNKATIEDNSKFNPCTYTYTYTYE